MNQFLPSPRVSHQDRFEFFAKIRGDIRKSRFTTVSTTPVANLPLVSTTPAANFATSFASVVDTGGQCCGTGMFILDPGSDFFPSRIPDSGSELSPSRIPDPGSASKNLNVLTQKKRVLSSRKYDPGYSSRIPDPGSASTNLSVLTQKKWFLSSRKYDPGGLFIPDPESGC